MKPKTYSFKYKKALCTIENKSRFVNDFQCLNFVSKYLPCYLSDFVYYDDESELQFCESDILENCKNLKIVIKDEADKIIVFINGEKHISIVNGGFHSAQMLCECENTAHESFFHMLHSFKVSGIEIFSI